MISVYFFNGIIIVGSNNMVENNTIYDNGLAGIWIFNGEDNYVINNIVYDNRKGWYINGWNFHKTM